MNELTIKDSAFAAKDKIAANLVLMSASAITGMSKVFATADPAGEGGGNSPTSGIGSFDISNGTAPNTGGNITDAGGKVMDTGRKIVTIATGIAALLLLFYFIIRVVQIAQSSDNPGQKRQAISGVLWVLIAVALLGGTSFITGLVWGIFQLN